MKVKNIVARLITVDIEGTKYKFLPAGAAVDVPNDAKKKSPYFATMIKDRFLEVVTTGSDDDLVDQAAKEAEKAKKDELMDQAKELGIDAKGTWGIKKLQEEIDAKLAE